MNDASDTYMKKTRALGHLMSHLFKYKGDVTNNRERVIELVNTINAMIIPRGWIGLDDDARIHLTRVCTRDFLPRTPVALTYAVDVIWDYDPLSSTVTCAKSRFDDFVGMTRLCQSPPFHVDLSPTKKV
jgi:hypothetical protein